jgi:hypothetical protein
LSALIGVGHDDGRAQQGAEAQRQPVGGVEVVVDEDGSQKSTRGVWI